MVLDIDAFGVLQRALHRVELLGDVETFALALDHLNNSAQMTVGAAQAVEHIGMGSVNHHRYPYPIPQEGILQAQTDYWWPAMELQRMRS